MTNLEPANWMGLSLRICAAMLTGALVGIDRDLHRKSLGMRTLGLVALGSCLLVLTVTQYALQHGSAGVDAASRVTQGIVSGIGFLGAGVILHGPEPFQVFGLTSAAAILVVASLGVACALAIWPILLAGLGATLLLLTVFAALEHALQRSIEKHDKSA